MKSTNISLNDSPEDSTTADRLSGKRQNNCVFKLCVPNPSFLIIYKIKQETQDKPSITDRNCS